MSNWFEIDRSGLAKLLTRYGRERVVLELIANALDTNAKQITVRMSPLAGRPLVDITVIDDDPDGFKDLAHAFTLFAESERKSDATKRGRFNLGEKLVLACCESAIIRSTTGSIHFGPTGRTTSREKLKKGSSFGGVLRMTRDELTRAVALVHQIIVPDNVELRLESAEHQGEFILQPKLIAEFETTLPTEFADVEGNLRRTSRKTKVRVFEPADNGPQLYELGIPVMPFEGGEPWHVSVEQKVPLTMDRTTVLPSFLRTLQVAIANAMTPQIKDGTASWVREAMSDERVDEQVVRSVVKLRFGEQAVSYDPSDQEANKIATSKGYTVVSGGAASKEEWANIRRTGALQPAGQVTPSPRAYGDGPMAQFLDKSEWTLSQAMIADHAKLLARKLLLDLPIRVRFVKNAKNFQAAWLTQSVIRVIPELHFSIAALGSEWFEDIFSFPVRVDGLHDLLIHEFSHHFSPDHLSSDFHEALSRLGSKLARLALEEPELFQWK